MKSTPGWKFLCTGLRSSYGSVTWKLGAWQKVEGDLVLCGNGLHLCPTPFAAFGYVKGEIIARVEGRGDDIQDTDKSAWRELRVIEAWHWGARDSAALAIFAAEKVIGIYEARYPNDKRLREAIEAAKAYPGNPKDPRVARAARAAARAAAEAAAEAARAAEAAAWAGESTEAARAAEAAAWAAEAADAAVEAAWPARAAAGAARAAAWAAWVAGKAEIENDINKWMVDRTQQLEAIK